MRAGGSSNGRLAQLIAVSQGSSVTSRERRHQPSPFVLPITENAGTPSTSFERPGHHCPRGRETVCHWGDSSHRTRLGCTPSVETVPGRAGTAFSCTRLREKVHFSFGLRPLSPHLSAQGWTHLSTQRFDYTGFPKRKAREIFVPTFGRARHHLAKPETSCDVTLGSGSRTFKTDDLSLGDTLISLPPAL